MVFYETKRASAYSADL
ncbi:hypothetical protein GBAR_LOCUS12675, partial [Geodia barretti]